MEVTHPSALWLLLLLIPLCYFSKNSLAGLPRWRFIVSLFLRIVIFVLIISALAEIQLVKPNDRLCVMFVLDVSKSLSDRNKMDAITFISKAIEKKSPRDEAGLIVFGGNSLVEFTPDTKPQSLKFLTSIIDGNRTNIASSLRLALAMFPGDANKRIVLLSDGQENMGDGLTEAMIIGSNDIPVDVIPLNSSLNREIYISEFSSPERANLDEPFDTKVVLQSTLSSGVRLQFYRDNKLIGEESLLLKPGKNIFFIPQKLQESGFYTYEAQLITDKTQDTLIENNKAWTYTRVIGKPRILLVDSKIDQSSYLFKALKFEDLNVVLVGPSNIPTKLSELQNYESIILNDVSAMNLSSEQMIQIRSYVRDLGGGLIMIGGENSFGVGGYYNTPVEEALPVSMDIRKNRNLPTMALVLAIDKSGSMADFNPSGQEKVALAREAAIACIDLLSSSDQIGVIGFDDSSKWIVPFQQTTENKDRIISDIASLKAGGGTDAYPALNEARRVMGKTEALLKHVILLSDGMTAPGKFDELVKSMSNDKITLSCVAIGRDADIPFMQSLAKKGGGRFYFTSDVSLLPQIFTKETFIASRAAIVEENFIPLLNKYSQVIKGIDWNKAPPLGGYVVTTPKDRAEVLLLATEDDPLLAQWYYGLGKSLAFTSDAKNRWAPEWIKWYKFPVFWSQAIRWSMRNEEASFLDSVVSYENNQGNITVDAVDEEGEFINLLELKAKIIEPDMKTSEVSLEQKGAGRYEASFPCDKKGTYIINIGGEKVGYYTRGFSHSTGAEYRNLGTDMFLLSSVARETNGRKLGLEDYNRVFLTPPVISNQVKEIWPFFILLVIFLWPLDIAIRRVFLPDDWQDKLLKRFKVSKPLPVIDVPLTLSRLKTRKSKVVYEREEKKALMKKLNTDEKNDVKDQNIAPVEKKMEEPLKKKIEEPQEVKQLGSPLARLKDVKKKALDDFK